MWRARRWLSTHSICRAVRPVKGPEGSVVNELVFRYLERISANRHCKGIACDGTGADKHVRAVRPEKAFTSIDEIEFQQRLLTRDGN